MNGLAAKQGLKRELGAEGEDQYAPTWLGKKLSVPKPLMFTSFRHKFVHVFFFKEVSAKIVFFPIRQQENE